MSEVPRMPSREEILSRATQLFIQERSRLGLPAITPEESELKEGSYFEKARNELMSGLRSQLEGYLAYLEDEASKVKAELGIVEVIPEEKITELENKLSNITERYKVTKERLEEARTELARIKAPPTPLIPPKGLSKEQVAKLEDAFRRVFEEARIERIPMATFRDEIAVLTEDLKDIERTRAYELAYERIVSLARSILPPRPTPTVAPPPAPPPTERPEALVPIAQYLGARTRRIEMRTCIIEGCYERFEADRDLEYRVRLVPVAKYEKPKTGTVFEPLLRIGNDFYFMCPRHRKEIRGYDNIYDCLAWLLSGTEIGEGGSCITEATFREVGLDDRDIEQIRKEKTKYLPTGGFLQTS